MARCKAPWLRLYRGGGLGDGADFVIEKKYLTQGEPLNGNFIRYDFSSQNWDWVTSFSQDSLDFVEFPFPNPNGSELVLAQHLDNAWQLFTMDSDGNNVKKITKLGGSEVGWSKDGTKVHFNRDVHKAPGARYIPHYYELETGKIDVLWPHLPDSVPQFPELNTQSPIDFRAIIQDSTSVPNTN